MTKKGKTPQYHNVFQSAVLSLSEKSKDVLKTDLSDSVVNSEFSQVRNLNSLLGAVYTSNPLNSVQKELY